MSGFDQAFLKAFGWKDRPGEGPQPQAGPSADAPWLGSEVTTQVAAPSVRAEAGPCVHSIGGGPHLEASSILVGPTLPSAAPRSGSQGGPHVPLHSMPPSPKADPAAPTPASQASATPAPATQASGQTPAADARPFHVVHPAHGSPAAAAPAHTQRWPIETPRPAADRADAGRVADPATSRVPLSSVAESLKTPAEPAPEPVAPLWQVDRFHWPAVCLAVQQKLGSELDALAEELLAGSRHHPEVVAFASARRGAGCTTLLLTLARALAHRGENVALVDADLEHPQLARRLRVRVSTGWEEVLGGALPPGEAMIDSLEDHVTLVGLVRPAGRPDELRNSFRFDLLLRLLQTRHHVVLVDAGPAESPVPGAWQFPVGMTSRITRAVMVCDRRQDSVPNLARLAEAWQQQNVPLWGVMENYWADESAGPPASPVRATTR